MTTYRALHNEAPAYISEMLTPYTPPKTLRSTNTSLLTVPTTHTKHGDREFSCAAPRLWNELAISINKLSLHFYFQTICQDLSIADAL